MGDEPAFGDAEQLGVRTEALHPEHLVPDCEVADGGADRLDDAGELHPQDPLSRATNAEQEPPEERVGPASMAVGAVDRRRMHADEDLVAARHRALHLCEPEHVRRAVPVVDNCPHRRRPLRPVDDAPTYAPL